MDEAEPRFLRPARPHLAATRHICAGLDDPREAWARLVDERVLPRDWLDDPRRRFVLDPPHEPTREPAFHPCGPHPVTVEQCALHAADVEGMVVAEHAARELTRRLAPFGAPPCERIRWWAISRTHHDYASSDTRPGVSYALVDAFSILHAIDDRPPGPADRLFGFGRYWAQVWERVAAAGRRIRPTRSSTMTAGRRFAELDNPFAPLADLEAAGYATLEYTSAAGESRGAMVVVAPI